MKSLKESIFLENIMEDLLDNLSESNSLKFKKMTQDELSNLPYGTVISARKKTPKYYAFKLRKKDRWDIYVDDDLNRILSNNRPRGVNENAISRLLIMKSKEWAIIRMGWK